MFNLATLTIVVPCFNEEEMLPISIPKFLLILEDLICKKLIDDNSKLMFIDDGSEDKTWEIILNYHQDNFLVTAFCVDPMTARKYQKWHQQGACNKKPHIMCGARSLGTATE